MANHTQQDTESDTRRIDQVHHIYPLTPIRIGPFKISPKYLIGAALFAFCFVVDVITLIIARQAWPFAVTIDVCALLFYFLLLHRDSFDNRSRPRLAQVFRKSNKVVKRLRGLTLHISPQPEIGEFFGAIDPEDIPPPKIDLIGELRFSKQPLYEGADEYDNMGIIEDVSYETASVTARVEWSSIRTAEESTIGQRLAAYAAMLDAMAQESDVVQWFKWRDMKIKGEAINPYALLKEVREGSRIQAPPSQKADELFVRRTLDVASRSWIHRSTITLAAYIPAIQAQIKARGGLGNVLLDRMESFAQTVFPDPERGDISPIGLRSGTVLTYRDLILDTRLSLDPIFTLPLWENGVSQPGGPYLDAYDAYPGFACFDEEEYPEWRGCIKVGQTYMLGFYMDRLTSVGLTSRQWAEIMELDITRTVVVTTEPMLPRVAKRRARAGTAGRTKSDMHPSDRVEFERAAQFESDIAHDRGKGGKLRTTIVVWGATPDEVHRSAAQLRDVALNNRVSLRPLSNMQDKGVVAMLPTARDLRAPDIPLGLQLIGASD